MKQTVIGFFILLILLSAVAAFGQSVRVDPNGEFSAQTLSLPYAFFNESFGFAVGYGYGVVGRHPTPVRPWAVCGGYAATPRSTSTTGPPSIMRPSCA